MRKILLRKRLLGLLVLIGMGTNLHAACAGDTCTNVTIDSLFAMTNGTILVYTSGNETVLNCTSDAVGYVTIDPADEGKNAIYALLLTAKTTATPVNIRVIPGSQYCRIAYTYN